MLELLSEVVIGDGVRDIVDVIGIERLKLCGGSSIYIPSESNLIKLLRNKKI